MIGQEEENNIENADGLPASQEQQVQPNVEQANQEPIWGPEKFDGQQFGLDYKGQKVFPTDATHLKNLAQQGYSYNTKMEDLKKLQGQQETEHNEMKQKYGRYDDIDKIMKEDPAFNTQIMNLFNNRQNGTNTEVEGAGGNIYNREYEGQLGEMRKELDTIKDKEDDRFLQNEIDKLRKDYPNHDWYEDKGEGSFETHLLQHAQDNGFKADQLGHVFRSMTYNNVRQQSIQQGADQNANKVKAQHRAGIVQGVQSTSPPQTKKYDHTGKSWQQSIEDAKTGFLNR